MFADYNKKQIVYNSECFQIRKDLEGYFTLGTESDKENETNYWWHTRDEDEQGLMCAGFSIEHLEELRDLIDEVLADEEYLIILDLEDK